MTERDLRVTAFARALRMMEQKHDHEQLNRQLFCLTSEGSQDKKPRQKAYEIAGSQLDAANLAAAEAIMAMVEYAVRAALEPTAAGGRS